MNQHLPERALRSASVIGVTAAAVLALLVAGCADMGAVAPTPKMQTAQSLGLSAASTAPDAQAAPAIESRWWLALGDRQLNALLDQAIAGNPNLKVAQARLARARASVAIAQSADLPQFNAELDLMRQKFSDNSIYPPPLGGSVQENATLQFNASWEIDFFGKNRSALNAALGTAQAAAAEADAARVLLASNLVRAYVQWARQNDRLLLAQRTLAQRQELLKLVRDRVSAGLDTRLQLKQSESSVPEARQQLEAINEQIAIARHAIEALVAQPKATESLAPPSLVQLRALALQPVLPADLLGRRADIAAARWRVEAASSDVANAKTLFYPNVNLVAFAGLQSIGFGNLLQSSSQQWGVGPAIQLPVFEGGRLRANLRGKAADLDAAIESYNATVIDAVREVADQIASLQSVARQQVQQKQAQAAAEAAYDIGLQRYRAGLGNYLDVLAVEVQVLAQRRDSVELAARALESQVGLARALGGGWQPSELSPTATTATTTAAIPHP